MKLHTCRAFALAVITSGSALSLGTHAQVPATKADPYTWTIVNTHAYPIMVHISAGLEIAGLRTSHPCAKKDWSWVEELRGYRTLEVTTPEKEQGPNYAMACYRSMPATRNSRGELQEENWSSWVTFSFSSNPNFKHELRF